MLSNSSCINHGRYLNYTRDIDLLLQLEYDAMNYIDLNISNQYCRNYLKTAVCVTIYPPCNDAGGNVTVQRLCSVECNRLLNDPQCLQVTTAVANIIWKNVSISVTINCTDSLDFATSFLEVLPDTVIYYSKICFPILESVEVPKM